MERMRPKKARVVLKGNNLNQVRRVVEMTKLMSRKDLAVLSWNKER